MLGGKPPHLKKRPSSLKSCETFPARWGFSAFQFSDGGLNQIRNRKKKKTKTACETQGVFEQKEIILGSHYGTFSEDPALFWSTLSKLMLTAYIFSSFNEFFVEFRAKCPNT